MARKRMLAPEFFTSATMNAVSVEAMLTFAGIWCWADDFGRGENDETLMKSAIWPRRRSVTDRKVRGFVDELIGSRVLCGYAVNGIELVHVTSWREHQKISHPTKSKLAPCQEHEPEAWAAFAIDNDHALAKFRSDSGMAPESIRSVS
jgi:hypothetical protein